MTRSEVQVPHRPPQINPEGLFLFIKKYAKIFEKSVDFYFGLVYYSKQLRESSNSRTSG